MKAILLFVFIICVSSAFSQVPLVKWSASGTIQGWITLDGVQYPYGLSDSTKIIIFNKMSTSTKYEIQCPAGYIFLSPNSSTISSVSVSLVTSVLDISGDGKEDMLIPYGYSSPWYFNYVGVLFVNGATGVTVFNFSDSPSFIADIDGDGNNEIVCHRSITSDSSWVAYSTSGIVSNIKSQSQQLPFTFQLNQNFPNPFNPSTNISYSISKSSHVKLRIFDLQGRELKTLVDEFQNMGSHNIELNSSGLSSGIYFYQLESSGGSQSKKCILIK